MLPTLFVLTVSTFAHFSQRGSISGVVTEAFGAVLPQSVGDAGRRLRAQSDFDHPHRFQRTLRIFPAPAGRVPRLGRTHGIQEVGFRPPDGVAPNPCSVRRSAAVGFGFRGGNRDGFLDAPARNEMAAFADRHNIPLMLDPAPARKLSTDLLQRVTWITPDETEMQELLETQLENADQGSYTAADRLLTRGVKNIVLKLGSRGCVIAERNLPKERVLAFSVNAVDTTAAGDVFNAGFAVGLMHGSTVKRGAVFASAVAAISVTRHGAQPSMPTSAEVKAFLRKRLRAEASLVAVETTNQRRVVWSTWP